MKESNHNIRPTLRDTEDHILRTVAMILVNFTSLILKSLQKPLWRLRVTLTTVNNISDQWTTFVFFIFFKNKGRKWKTKSMSMKF